MQTYDLVTKYKESGAKEYVFRKKKAGPIKKISMYLNKLQLLQKSLLISSNPDVFLSEYNNQICSKCKEENIPCKINDILLPSDDAIGKMKTFHNGIFGKIIRQFETLNFSVLIAGSSGIAAVLKKTHDFVGFEPKDLDIYVKDITDEKIILIDKAIRNVFPEDKVLIIRRPLTLTWWIYNKYYKFKMEIQLNVLKIRSWADIFIMYHSDLVSIGYDVGEKKFVTLLFRWEQYINMHPKTYFSNINNTDEELIIGAAKKYNRRGFVPIILKIVDQPDQEKKK